ncbi:alpha/beta fold hydrolase [Streptomyces rubellomurinus]|uniref:alpha/beta fold hydrolase n=1 Tax=Streptomyces rubellomurinus (strain ATCC 31215) TaxID=359131 RepID=UPI0005F244D9|nr:alpha/beta hydrolase [Streptomyces rubellomurinus]
MSTDLRHSHLPVDGRTLHVVESGDPAGRPYLFLHGWPESWRTWLGVMAAAPDGVRTIAVDLPGIGGSVGAVDGGSKRALAAAVHALVRELGLADAALIGHDAGGMAAYAYLRRYREAGDRERVGRVVIMNTVIPGVPPWEDVLRNPYIWHFGLHAVPDLPETLVQGRQAVYFDYFYDVLSADPRRITAESRAAHAAAYGSPAALTAGFDLYRAFAQDARDNAASAEAGPVETPLLYVRGDREGGDLRAYAQGFREAGVRRLTTAVVADAGHFAQEEQPAEVWRLIAEFAA